MREGVRGNKLHVCCCIAGFRHSPGGAVARNYSKTHETGSSGEVSTSAADKNVCSEHPHL